MVAQTITYVVAQTIKRVAQTIKRVAQTITYVVAQTTTRVGLTTIRVHVGTTQSKRVWVFSFNVVFNRYWLLINWLLVIGYSINPLPRSRCEANPKTTLVAPKVILVQTVIGYWEIGYWLLAVGFELQIYKKN